jgi:hypothetical protein
VTCFSQLFAYVENKCTLTKNHLIDLETAVDAVKLHMFNANMPLIRQKRDFYQDNRSRDELQEGK